MTKIELTDDEAKLFLIFQKKHAVLAPMLGYMDMMQLDKLVNCSIQLDTDAKGIVVHTAITKHFR